ncbi:cellulose-binding domain-containing protein [Dactylosporangium sp. NPDC051484]|uniref:cellulose-binding domain-containing protein n=1 Tax=Dactylosporangium sp. NPDC051484 TaxID=3154942 RepID=UPI00344D0114
MRKLAAAALAALCTAGAALAATAPAHAADPACTGTIRIASMTWSPAQIMPGQGSTLTLVAQNCTGTAQQVSLFSYGRFLGAGSDIPPGCPVIDPLAPRQITIAAGETYTATSGYGTFATCTATRLQVTAQFSIDGTPVASRSADLAIAPIPPKPGCAVTYRTTSRWDGGFVAQVTVADIAAAPIDGWRLAFNFGGDQRVNGAWNATTAQSGAAVTARNEDWNAVISPGGTATFGITGTWHDSDAPPTAFTVNGAPCEVR